MTNSERSALETQLRERLDDATVRNTRAIARFAEANGLVPTDLRALVLLERAERDGRKALTPGELSRLLDLSSGAITYLVERLARAGLASSQRDPLDRRRARVRATAQGKRTVARFHQGLGGAATLVLGAVPDEELAAAAKVLQLLDGALVSYCDQSEA